MNRAEIDRLPGMAGLVNGADHVDVHTMDGTGSVLEVAAGILSYRPAWMGWLWRVPVRLLRWLGPPPAIPAPARLTGESLPAKPGDKAGFFTVTRSDGHAYWVVEGRETHLEAWLAVVGQPLEAGRTRFHVITVVRYLNRAGRIYFNVIRPFHHLVVRSALRSVLRKKWQDGTGGDGKSAV